MHQVITYPKFIYGPTGKIELNRVQLSNHFNLKEFHCPCGECYHTMVAPILVNACEILRTVAGEPLRITSGYRCTLHNESLKNSSKDSQHIKGLAVDIRTVSRLNINTLYAEALRIEKIGAVGRYINNKKELERIHMDFRESEYIIEWEKPA